MVGISEYTSLNKLKNARNDALAIARLLKAAGATVIHEQDCHIIALREAKDKFFNLLNEGDIAIFFFAGHGCQFKNQQLCLARSLTRMERTLFEMDIRTFAARSIKIDRLVMDLKDRKTHLNLILLDCCRSFEYSSDCGRSEPYFNPIRPGDQQPFNLNFPKGTVVGHATALGDISSDGPACDGLNGSEHGTHLLLSTSHQQQLCLPRMANFIRTHSPHTTFCLLECQC